jgi:hypothetical protein
MLKSKSFTIQEAQKKLENYCAYQERCHQEVIQKLKSLNMIQIAIDQIIGKLITSTSFTTNLNVFNTSNSSMKMK